MLTNENLMITPSWKALSILAVLTILFTAPLMWRTAGVLENGTLFNWLKPNLFGRLSSWFMRRQSSGITQQGGGLITGGKYRLLGGFKMATSFLIRLPLVVVFASNCVGQFSQGLSRMGSTVHIYLCKKLVRIFPDMVYEITSALHIFRGRKKEEPYPPY